MALAIKKLGAEERKRLLDGIKRLFEMTGINALDKIESLIQRLESELKKE